MTRPDEHTDSDPDAAALEERHPDDVISAAVPYRVSHRGAGKAAEYDHDFWSFGSAKFQSWTIERRLLARVFDELLAAPPERALDFACGTGRVLAELEQRVPATVGIDVSPEMLAIAGRRCTRSRLICADVTSGAEASPQLDRPFDLVTSFRFFLNAEPGLRRASLQWLHGHLSPQGRLVANFHLNPNSLRGLYLRARWRGHRRVPMLSIGEIERLLAEAGFAIVDVQGYEYLPYRRDGAALALPHLRARVEDLLFARPGLRRVAGCHLVVARPV